MKKEEERRKGGGNKGRQVKEESLDAKSYQI